MKRGEICLVNLSPAIGTELKDLHYCVVVQSGIIEHDLRPRTIVVPFTSVAPKKFLPYVVQVDPPEGDLKHRSYALCDQVTRIDKSRIVKSGALPLSSLVMAKIDEALRLVLEL